MKMKLNNIWKLYATGGLLMSVDYVKISANNFVMTSFPIYLMSGCLGTEIHWIFQHSGAYVHVFTSPPTNSLSLSLSSFHYPSSLLS